MIGLHTCGLSSEETKMVALLFFIRDLERIRSSLVIRKQDSTSSRVYTVGPFGTGMSVLQEPVVKADMVRTGPVTKFGAMPTRSC